MPDAIKEILIVDDDKTFCKVLALKFQENGFQTYMAFDGESSLKLFKEKHPPLVLLDIAMPGMNGFEVAEAIRASETPDKHTTIIIMTAHARSFFVSKEFESQIDSYLTKPITPEDVFNHVNSLMN
jgi:CheY-like chemotaxis protein